MTLFTVSNLSKAYYEKSLFQEISFGMEEGERVGIIGRNGVGKSSLLKIIAGIDEPDSGEVVFNSQARMMYLEQAPEFEQEDTALSFVLRAKPEQAEMLQEYSVLCQMHSRNSTDEMTERINHLTSELSDMGAWNLETLAKKFLSQLGIIRFDDHVRDFSGGMKKRVALARAILSEPDLLLLDEPTNHLDADSVQWLQDHLASSPRALLLITHDRYFLDAVTTRIVEIDRNKLISFPGSYERYLERKEAMVESEQGAATHLRNKIRQELVWLQKGAKARRTKQQSRIDWIEKMRAEPAPPEEKNIKIELGSKFLGGKIIDCHNVSKSIGGKLLFHNMTFTAKPGDRIGIIGPNGAGKSTLLGVMAGRIEPDSGKVGIGESVSLGFFDQEITSLQENETLIANLRGVAEYIDTGVGRDRFLTAKDLLERFLFSPKQQNSYVHTLSGGEKRRLALLMILMKNPNVIFLDEPTNDFDLSTLSALEEYLGFFKGVLLVVSHDRSFLDATVTDIWHFDGDGEIKLYPGNYSDYLEKAEKERSRKNAQTQKAKSMNAGGASSSVKTRSMPSVKKTGLSFKEKIELKDVEGKIAKFEVRKSSIETTMTNETDYKLLDKSSKEMLVVQGQLEELETRWLELQEML